MTPAEFNPDELRRLQWAALDRMKRAHERGTGCHLTPSMIHALGLSTLVEIWSTPAEEDRT